jgi:hypothetical protein
MEQDRAALPQHSAVSLRLTEANYYFLFILRLSLRMICFWLSLLETERQSLSALCCGKAAKWWRWKARPRTGARAPFANWQFAAQQVKSST